MNWFWISLVTASAFLGIAGFYGLRKPREDAADLRISDVHAYVVPLWYRVGGFFGSALLTALFLYGVYRQAFSGGHGEMILSIFAMLTSSMAAVFCIDAHLNVVHVSDTSVKIRSLLRRKEFIVSDIDTIVTYHNSTALKLRSGRIVLVPGWIAYHRGLRNHLSTCVLRSKCNRIDSSI